MKKITPTKHYSSTLHQVCKLIPAHLAEKLARKHGVDKKSRTEYPQRLRRVEAWAASSICDLYHCRCGIEAFFKQIKQPFKVCGFLGHSKNAIHPNPTQPNTLRLSGLRTRIRPLG